MRKWNGSGIEGGIVSGMVGTAAVTLTLLVVLPFTGCADFAAVALVGARLVGVGLGFDCGTTSWGEGLVMAATGAAEAGLALAAGVGGGTLTVAVVCAARSTLADGATRGPTGGAFPTNAVGSAGRVLSTSLGQLPGVANVPSSDAIGDDERASLGTRDSGSAVAGRTTGSGQLM